MHPEPPERTIYFYAILKSGLYTPSFRIATPHHRLCKNYFKCFLDFANVWKGMRSERSTAARGCCHHPGRCFSALGDITAGLVSSTSIVIKLSLVFVKEKALIKNNYIRN